MRTTPILGMCTLCKTRDVELSSDDPPRCWAGCMFSPMLGDWVVQGTTPETIDVGPIRRLNRTATEARIAWESGEGHSIMIELASDDIEIYATRDAAYAERDRRRVQWYIS